ncbi:hypothetical protein [Limimaricola cinnabarinus]|uniref:Pectate lyase superfamily protein domain-containing protein n=1 Tax=Limimaricola cinnabarinus TaxID=1125964 RepID=A0A2G1MH59_9RHOB|nr:hypothetical protein [Limimaricola cinnabarinus]PHP27992.1 hypothetical protein CJ301_08380 [Limimaricola cinnabarinus]
MAVFKTPVEARGILGVETAIAAQAARDALRAEIGAITTGLTPAGGWSAASGAFPTGAVRGAFYIVTAAGTVDGQAFALGDWLVARVANASISTYAGNWVRADYSKILRQRYSSIGAIKASLETPRGAGAFWEGGDVLFEEVATGQHFITAGGAKLKAHAGADGLNLLAAGAAGDGVANDAAKLTAALAASTTVIVPAGIYNLGGGTVTVPAGSKLVLAGGMLTNGTLACEGAIIEGYKGLSTSITLTGAPATEHGVLFDWFDHEKATRASYDAFINGSAATFGPVPAIGTKNRTILLMLLQNKHRVRFNGGIYPFDAEIVPGNNSYFFEGQSRDETLLWCPNGNFLHYTAGSAVYPHMKNLTVEAQGSVLLTDAWSANAIHGTLYDQCFFISYGSHCFHNDYSTAGGTGCPIYGSKILNCAVYACAGKGGFFGWQSGSNVYDNVPDRHLFFNGQGTAKKGAMKAIFWNSNVRDYTNSNIAYAYIDYVAYYDRNFYLFNFRATKNIFESNTGSFKAIVKTSGIPNSNLFLDTRFNQYVNDVAKENGHQYILTEIGNVYLQGTDSPTPLYGSSIRNYSDQYVKCITPLLDASQTKYRLRSLCPHSHEGVRSTYSRLLAATAEHADLAGMKDYFDADSANISYVEFYTSMRATDSEVAYNGTTAQRPTERRYPGLQYFDTTIGKPIWWNGSAWVDHAGAAV